MRAIDVMGFAGGFTLGTVQAGFELVGKCEMPGGFGVPNCEANRHLLGDRWESQVREATEWEPIEAEYVFGNPPCSGFSLMSAKHFRGVDSPINACMHAFAEYVSRVRPLIAAFESVSQAYNQGKELMQLLHQKVNANTGLNYRLYHVLHNNLALGGCAVRKRYFWVVARIPFGVEHPELRFTPTLMEVIGDLQDAAITWEAQPYRRPAERWAEPLISETGTFDGHLFHVSPEYKRAMELLPTAGPWLPREPISKVARRYYEQTGTLPTSWAFKQDKLIEKDFFMGFHQLVRWHPNEPARVITGAGLMLVLHPTRDRLFTHREVARIMGFPDDWRIHPLRRQSNLRMTWGKGIPVGSGRWISSWVRRSILGRPGTITGVGDDNVGFLIDVTKPRVVKRESKEVIAA